MRLTDPLAALSPEDRALLKHHLRAPALTFLALLALLALNVALGATLPFSAHTWIVELIAAAAMAALILLVSMDVLREPPLVRLFSGLGFFWVAILVGMTLTDYLAR
jgi:cytochrome c oxidase subunit IV